MKNYYVIVETKATDKFPFKEKVAQIKIEGYNKFQVGYEWGKICCEYPEDKFNSNLVETKESIREFKNNPKEYEAE